MGDKRQTHKWLTLGTVGLASGVVTLLVFRSIPMASGTATIAVVALIAAKHLALAVAAGSPLAALFQVLKPKVRPYCPWARDDKE
ncbi:MAG TPA: hypothetical protein VMD53_06285 [Rhizomicrobium sp.]|nr:hypothetical protein [Rhizomicrobium sp.]